LFKPTSQLGRFTGAVKKIITPKVNIVANNSTKSFGKAFTREFGEETFEESIESIGEQIHPVL
jgi:hypothetical protein